MLSNKRLRSRRPLRGKYGHAHLKFPHHVNERPLSGKPTRRLVPPGACRIHHLPDQSISSEHRSV
ncbi:hypothetical protein SPHINGO8AM_70123 [Sphingomonas sp. 8AM]|nr:hypothetical protein SPHINGO8AM_70123 [Sphingomonas sp. 8AM]